MISITLFNNLAVKIGSVVKVSSIRTYFRKTNKLQNINTIGKGARNISIKKWEINYMYFKIKIIRFIINFSKLDSFVCKQQRNRPA